MAENWNATVTSEAGSTAPMMMCGPTVGCGKAFALVPSPPNHFPAAWCTPPHCPHCGKENVAGPVFIRDVSACAFVSVPPSEVMVHPDTARLDWLERQRATVRISGNFQPVDDHPWDWTVQVEPWFRDALDRVFPLREAIDAAILSEVSRG